MRKHTSTIALLTLLFALFVLSTSTAANVIWVGEIKGMDTRELEYNTFLISFNIEEDTTDGRFGKFIEDDIIFTTTENDSKVVKIILDGVSAGIYADKLFELEGLVKSMSFKDLVGSFRNPEIRYTLSDKEIFSAEITIASQNKLSLVRVPVSKTDTSKLSLSFKLIVVDSTPKNVVTPDMRPNNVLELTMDDFSEPFPANLVELSGDFAKQYDMLNRLPTDSFVSFFYPMKHMRPSIAQSLFTKKLSPWGWMTCNDDHGVLVLTDYASYVRSIVESILVFDRPVPQVEVVAKVLEITMTDQESRGFLYRFTKDFPDKTDISLGQYSATEGTGLSGLSAGISHYSDGNLRNFMAMLDIAVREGKGNVLASPRALVLNNQTGDFRVGETYYYLGSNGVSDSGEKYEKVNTNDSKESYEKENWSESFGLRTISTGVRLNVRPTILNSDQMTLYLTLGYDEVVGFSGPNEFPVLANRQLSTFIRMKDGQTLVIGGLFREKDVTMRKKVPGLGDIPGLGVLFSARSRERVKSELVFIMTITQVK